MSYVRFDVIQRIPRLLGNLKIEDNGAKFALIKQVQEELEKKFK